MHMHMHMHMHTCTCDTIDRTFSHAWLRTWRPWSICQPPVETRFIVPNRHIKRTKHMHCQCICKHAQQATYKGAPNADQFMGNQSREFMIQSHHSNPAHAHVHLYAPAQAPIEAHKVPNPTERPAVAASSLAVRDPDEVG